MQTYNLKFSFLLLCFLAIVLVASPVANAGPGVRSQTAAVRATTPSSGLRGSFVNTYEQRIISAEQRDERYAEQYAKWKATVARVKYQNAKRETDRLRKEQEKEEADKRRRIEVAARDASRNKKRGAQEEELTISKRNSARAEVKPEVPVVKDQVAVATEPPVKKSWSLWGSNTKSPEEEVDTEDTETAAVKEEPKTRRSLWGHLKKALW